MGHRMSQSTIACYLASCPNASRCKMRKWVYSVLATPFGQALNALVLTCAHFGPDQCCTQVKASFSQFGHRTQVNLLLANEVENSLSCNDFFFLPDLHVLGSPFGHPTQASGLNNLVIDCNIYPTQKLT